MLLHLFWELPLYLLKWTFACRPRLQCASFSCCPVVLILTSPSLASPSFASLASLAFELRPCFCVGCTRIVSARQQPRQKGKSWASGFYSYLHANICFPRFWLAQAWAKVHFVLIFSLQIRIKTNAKVKIRTTAIAIVKSKGHPRINLLNKHNVKRIYL